jgi:D-alanyl-D-alanine carboxypeptidase
VAADADSQATPRHGRKSRGGAKKLAATAEPKEAKSDGKGDAKSDVKSDAKPATVHHANAKPDATSKPAADKPAPPAKPKAAAKPKGGAGEAKPAPKSTSG